MVAQHTCMLKITSVEFAIEYLRLVGENKTINEVDTGSKISEAKIQVNF